jgi:hypothetical protein
MRKGNIPENFTGTTWVVWSGSLKVNPGVLFTYEEALEWKNKINDMGRRASIESMEWKEGKLVY